MQKIALPQNIEYTSGKNPNEGQVVVKPLYPGYGITLGNSIRRVLLSSLPGAAPIGIKIKGVSHEFMTLPHLKEDILEFILNLKQLRLKVFTDEVVKLELAVHGKKDIKAADIKGNSSVEIINPDLVLGTITDMAGSMEAEIFVSRGMGYEMFENREEKNSEIDYIEMDSIFSPVISAGIRVENVRVGKMTNWDKLILDIKTDGTIKYEDAFMESVKILIEQFNSLIGEVKEDENKEEKEDKGTEAAAVHEDLKDEKEEPVKDEEEEKPKKKRGRPKKTE